MAWVTLSAPSEKYTRSWGVFSFFITPESTMPTVLDDESCSTGVTGTSHILKILLVKTELLHTSNSTTAKICSRRFHFLDLRNSETSMAPMIKVKGMIRYGTVFDRKKNIKHILIREDQ